MKEIRCMVASIVVVYRMFPHWEISQGGTPYIQMIGMIVVFFRGCNR